MAFVFGPTGKILMTHGGRIAFGADCCCDPPLPCEPYCLHPFELEYDCNQREDIGLGCVDLTEKFSATLGSISEASGASSQPHYDVFQHLVANGPGSHSFGGVSCFPYPIGNAASFLFFWPEVVKIDGPPENPRAYSWFIRIDQGLGSFASPPLAGYARWSFQITIYSWNGCGLNIGDPSCCPDDDSVNIDLIRLIGSTDPSSGSSNGDNCGPLEDIEASDDSVLIWYVNTDYIDDSDPVTLYQFTVPQCCFCSIDDIPEELEVTLNPRSFCDHPEIPNGNITIQLPRSVFDCPIATYTGSWSDSHVVGDCTCDVFVGITIHYDFDRCKWIASFGVSSICSPTDPEQDPPPECGYADCFSDEMTKDDCTTPVGTYTDGVYSVTIQEA